MSSTQPLLTSEPESILPSLFNTIYNYETASTLHYLPHPSSPPTQTTIEFTTLSGPDKITYLLQHGHKLTKKPLEQRGMIMIHYQGAWIHWNEGQLEYMLPSEGEEGEEFVRLNGEGWGEEERRDWVMRKAVRIREWPESVRRVQSGKVGDSGSEKKEGEGKER